MITALGALALAGKGALWGGTAIGAAAGGTQLLGYGDHLREQALQRGLDDDGNIKTNWWENAWIDEQSLVPQYNKRQKKSVLNDPRITQMQMQLGENFAIQDGWDLSKTLGANAGAYKKSLLEEDRAKKLQQNNDLYNSPQQVEERRRRDQQFNAQLKLQSDQMAENAANRQTTLQLGQINARTAAGNQSLQRQLGALGNQTTLQLAQMDSELADKRMAFDRETHRMDRRDRNIAQLMSGLGQLGGAFAL